MVNFSGLGHVSVCRIVVHHEEGLLEPPHQSMSLCEPWNVNAVFVLLLNAARLIHGRVFGWFCFGLKNKQKGKFREKKKMVVCSHIHSL